MPDFFVGYPERRLLIDAFVEARPAVKLELQARPTEPLLRDLEQGDLDAAMGFSTSLPPSLNVEMLPLKRRYGHLMIPSEDPLARAKRVTLDMLAGRTLMVSPGRTDPRAIRIAYAPLVAVGTTLVAAPEANRRTIEQVARAQRTLCVRWSALLTTSPDADGMVCRPIEGYPLFSETALWRRRPPSPLAVTQFWEVAQQLVTRLATEMAGDPLYPA
jgi:DNA-binding transcriptional LysR family regulator